jgi:Berberine and berberine like
MAWAPDELMSSFRLLHLPPVRTVPEFLRGARVAAIDAAYLGASADGAELLAPLRAVGSPVIDTFGTMPAAELRRLHGDPEQPVPGIGDGFVIDELTGEGVDALLALGGADADSPLVALEFRHLGGALGVAGSEHGALAALEGAFTVYGVGTPLDGLCADAIHAHLDAVADAMRPWTRETSYLNFADRPGTRERSFGPDTAARLEAVKRRHDPNDVFRSNRRLPG